MIESKKRWLNKSGAGEVVDWTKYRSTRNLLVLDRNAVIEEED